MFYIYATQQRYAHTDTQLVRQDETLPR